MQLLCLVAQECQENYDKLAPYSRPDTFIERLSPKKVRYESTVLISLHGFRLDEVIAHDTAVDRPTTCQMSQGDFQLRGIGTIQVWGRRRWSAFCDRVRQSAAINKRKSKGKTTNAPLPLQSKAKVTSAKVKENKALASLRMPPAWSHKFGVPSTRRTTKTRLATPFAHTKIP